MKYSDHNKVKKNVFLFRHSFGIIKAILPGQNGLSNFGEQNMLCWNEYGYN